MTRAKSSSTERPDVEPVSSTAGSSPFPTSGGQRTRARCELGPDALDGLRRVAESDPLGQFVVLVSAVSWTLGRWLGRESVGVATEPMLLVVPVLPDDTIRDHLARAQEVFERTYASPSNPGPDISAATNVSAGVEGVAGFASPPDGALVVTLLPGDEAAVRVDFDRSLVGDELADRLATSLSSYLAALRALDTRLADLPVWTTDMLEELHAAAAGPAMEIPSDLTFRDLVASRAVARPEAAAIVERDASTTYGELAGRAERLAHELAASYGIAHGDRVGVLLENGSEIAVAILALFELGATYVPLDPAWPSARVAGVARATSLSALVTSMALMLPELATVPTFAVDVQEATPGPRRTTSLRGDDAAYLLSTSGTTGTPNLVLVEHASFANMALDQIAAAEITPADRVLQPFSPGFDASMLAIALALGSGAALVPVPRDVHDRAGALGELIESTEVTVAVVVPSVLRTIDPVRLASVRLLIVGGEPLTPSDLAEFGRGRRIINSYGATETSVVACAYAVPSDHASPAVPIGSPVSNSYTLVLSDSGDVVPAGFTGEIAVGGRALARGYWENDALTRRRFIPSPTRPGERVYLTGDLGRRRPDGLVELEGRRDRQVKLNGQRVELDEIEAALLSHSGVVQAAVECRVDGVSKTVVAFVAGSERLSSPALVEHLRGRLPRAAVPGSVVILDSLPLLGSGKIDREALRQLAPASARQDGGAAEPVDPIEHALVEIWRGVLGRSDVRTSDNFFELGGHSLSALRVLAEAQKRLGVEIRLAEIFEAPTIAALARLLRGRPAASRTTVARVPASSAYAASVHQRRLWLLEQTGRHGAQYHVPRAYRITGELDVPALRSAIKRLVERHEALRTTLELTGGRLVQTPRSVDADLLEIEELGDEATLARALADAQRRPFDLARDLPCRFHLFRLGADEHVLSMVFHHVAVDGASMAIVLDELAALYREHTRGYAASLPALTLTYKDYAGWHDTLLTGEGGARSRDYWLDRLSGLRHGRGFATPSAGRERTHRSAHVTSLLSEEVSQRVLALASEAHSSPFTVLAAAVLALLHRTTGERDLTLGTPSGTRPVPELDRVVGLFLNMLVLRERVDASDSFADLTKRLHGTVLSALDHRDYPFDALVEELAGPAEPGREPLFAVEIDYHSREIPGDPDLLDLAGPTCARVGGFESAGKFELDFIFTEHDAGIRLDLLYDTGLFDAVAAEAIASGLRDLVDACTREPDQPLAELAAASSAPAARSARHARMRRLQETASRASATDVDGVRAVLPSEHEPYAPVLLERVDGHRSSDAWLRANGELIERHLASNGAVLLRGFGVRTPDEFASILAPLGVEPVSYMERSSKRSEVVPRIYTSTEHPADQDIRLHNEHSYASAWPTRLVFCCLQPASRGGATPIADSRVALARLSDATRRRFETSGVRYVRNFGGLGLDWPEVFQTTDRDLVEAYCADHEIRCTWLPGGRLQTTAVRPAVRKHPQTGESVWFNHAYFFNVRSLDSELAADLFRFGSAESLPFETYYGDGSPISTDEIRDIGAAVESSRFDVVWQPGDLLVLDNMLRAHGRTAYEGSRTVLVAMSNLQS